MEFLKKYINYIILGACILIAVSVFLPLFTVSIEVFGYADSSSVNFIEGDGKIILGLIAATGVLVVIKKDIPALVLAAASAYITFIDVRNVRQEYAEKNEIFADMELIYGIGFYLLVIGLVIAIGGLIFQIVTKQKKNETAEFAPNNTGNIFNGMLSGNDKMNKEPEIKVTVSPVNNSSELICSYCGSKMQSSMNFCTNCGNKLNK